MLKQSLIAVCTLAAGAVAQAHAQDYAAPGSYAHTRLELPDLVDPARDDRLVATRITIPTGPGPFPLVIMSHGNGGNWSSHQHIVDHIASYGYIVLAPNHPASDTERVFRWRMDYASDANTSRDPLAVLGRPADVSFLIDQAERWNGEAGHALRGRIDLDHIAAVGHSYGSYTVLAVCGVRPVLDRLRPRVPPGTGFAPDTRDPRVDVGVVYSTTGPNSDYFTERSYQFLDCPMLNFNGDNDVQVSGGFRGSQERYRGWELQPPGDRYLAWLMNAGHNGWDDLSEASRWTRNMWARNTPEAEDAVRIANGLTVAFLEAYLRDDPTARAALNADYAQSLAGDVVDEVRWEQK